MVAVGGGKVGVGSGGTVAVGGGTVAVGGTGVAVGGMAGAQAPAIKKHTTAMMMSLRLVSFMVFSLV